MLSCKGMSITMRLKAGDLRRAISRASGSHVESSTTPANGSLRKSEVLPSPISRSTLRTRRKRLIGLLFLGVLLLIVIWWRWQMRRPQEVVLVHPAVTTITETIASSGRVRGVTETVVGAQAAGIVAELFVDEGDRVSAGQPLAVLERKVAEAQLAQAEQALSTARAQLAQVERGPRSSEVETAANKSGKHKPNWRNSALPRSARSKP